MERKQEQYGAAGIQRMKIELDAGDLLIVESETENTISIDVEMDERDSYESQTFGDTLQIEYDLKKHLFSNGNHKAHMTVKIPKGKHFEEFSLELGAGNANLSAIPIYCGNMKLEAGAGNVTIGKVEAERGLDVELGAGNVDIRDAKLKDLHVKCGVGDCRIGMEGNENDYNYDISCGVGQIRINDSYMKQIGGNENRRNPDAKGTVRLSCGVGNIEIQTNKY